MKRMNVGYRRLKTGNYLGRAGKYYVFIRKRKHGKWDGFEKYCFWYTVYIGANGTWITAEGMFTSYLKTIKKAKNWAAKKIDELIEYKL